MLEAFAAAVVEADAAAAVPVVHEWAAVELGLVPAVVVACRDLRRTSADLHPA